MVKEISCGFVLYKNSPEILFLLLKRRKSTSPLTSDRELQSGFPSVLNDGQLPSLTHPNDGEWDFPKGHQEKSETFYKTAKRELLEEAKINADKDIIVVNKNKKIKCFTYEYRAPSSSLRKIILFVGLCKKNPRISSEHRGFVWVKYDEAKKMLKFPEVCKCLEEIYNFVRTDIIPL